MAAATPSDAETVTIDMVHQYAYCPRRCYLMYVEGRWADNVYTEEGRTAHRRVDEEDEPLPDPSPAGDEEPKIARSVPLSSSSLGLTGKCDVLELDGTDATPVEYKRGNPPDNLERCWEPERVQLMAQALLLREAGYTVTDAYIWYTHSRTRVAVELDFALQDRTLDMVRRTRDLVRSTTLPPPLDHSPKCAGCSIGGICLPDETDLLRKGRAAVEPDEQPCVPEIRRLYPPADDAVPLYVQEQGASVHKRGQTLQVTCKGRDILSTRLIDVSQLVLCGSVSLSAAVLHVLAEAGIPVLHLSMGHWFYAVTRGFGLRNAFDRAAQFDAAAKPDVCLALAKAFVAAKVSNQRTLLRRNGQDVPDTDLAALSDLQKQVDAVVSIESLLGIEGMAARHYFGNFHRMLKPKGDSGFDFDHFSRNRRPPRDPINAMLSFGYAVLAKECSVALLAGGLDPHWGFYHRPRHGRPALALDMMEEFRPLVVDSAVVTALNNRMLGSRDFERTGNACMLNSGGRKAMLRAFEARMDHLVTHPLFDYRCSYRRIIAMQAQLLARHLRGEIPRYPGMVTR